MRVLIIEDEKPAADRLIRLLKNSAGKIEILDVIETVKQSVEWFKLNMHPELIFMDIQLDDGNSFEIFEQVSIESPVIFTTAYDEYAIKAFKVNSIDYLLKPIEPEQLEKAILKFESQYKTFHTDAGKINQIYSILKNDYKNRFLIKVGMSFLSIRVEDIECFYISERCTFLKTFSGKNYDVDFSLEQIARLTDPSRFFRINRGWIINFDSIKDIKIYSKNRLKLTLRNNTVNELIVSREKVADFKKWMDR